MGNTLQTVTVDGHDGFWISGEMHFFFYDAHPTAVATSTTADAGSATPSSGTTARRRIGSRARLGATPRSRSPSRSSSGRARPATRGNLRPPQGVGAVHVPTPDGLRRIHQMSSTPVAHPLARGAWRCRPHGMLGIWCFAIIGPERRIGRTGEPRTESELRADGAAQRERRRRVADRERLDRTHAPGHPRQHARGHLRAAGRRSRRHLGARPDGDPGRHDDTHPQPRRPAGFRRLDTGHRRSLAAADRRPRPDPGWRVGRPLDDRPGRGRRRARRRWQRPHRQPFRGRGWPPRAGQPATDHRACRAPSTTTPCRPTARSCTSPSRCPVRSRRATRSARSRPPRAGCGTRSSSTSATSTKRWPAGRSTRRAAPTAW